MSVRHQILVSFNISKYKDEVLCDVVPMQACYILLGQPWQFDRQVTHDGVSNRYSFPYGKQKIILVPLTPKQVYEDQMYLLRQMEESKKKNKIKSGGKEKERRVEKERVVREGEKLCLLAREREVRKI